MLCLGVTVAVVAWGYLVRAAIDFGVEARAGSSDAWLFLGLACLGAVACLFVGLMLVARLLRVLGITSSSPSPPREERDPSDTGAGAGPRSSGGRRVMR